MRLIPALAMSALCLIAPGAANAAAFPAFQADCLIPHADRKGALAAADAAGWITIDSSQVPIPAQQGFKLTDYDVRLLIEGGAFQALVVGKGEASFTPGQPGAPADLCMILSRPADADAVSKTASWAGVSPLLTQAISNTTLYAFTDTPTGHKPVGDAEAGKAALAAGVLYMAVTAQTPADLTVLGLIHFKP